MEIEKKFVVCTMPELSRYPVHFIEQAYLNTDPTLRIRREDDQFYITYKHGSGIAREEYNLWIDEKSYRHLLAKADGRIITKKRYLIPDRRWTIELDVFEGDFEGLVFAEVEYASVEEAESYTPPAWLGRELSGDIRYYNSYLSTWDAAKGKFWEAENE